MHTDPAHRPVAARLAVLAALAGLATPALAQTDDTAPFYAGASLGVSHVSNVYRVADAPNSDTVVGTGLLAGIDQRLGRQQLTLDGILQNNRYSTNSELNYRSHSLKGALNWQTVGNLSGVLSAKSDRSLADFNMGNGINPIFKKNIESNDQYEAIARLGVATRYTVEAGWVQRRRDFTASEYDRFVYRQDTGSLGLYATPGGNVRLGVVGRHTDGQHPRYPVGLALDPNTGAVVVISAPNEFKRDDIDLTARWTPGGHSALNARISRSKTRNGLEQLRDFSGTTGSISLDWRPTGKLQFNLQYARDTGQESVVRAADLNRVYTSWQLGATYAVTGKITASAKASSNRARRTSDAGVTVADAVDDTQLYNLGLRWAITRSFSLSCQYDRVKRDSSVAQYVYNASSYGCTGQALVY